MIDRGDAERVEEWIQEAIDGGARVLDRRRAGRLRSVQPTIIAGAAERMKVSCEELFAPVVGV